MTGFLGRLVKNKTTVIELEKGSKLPELTGDLRENLKTLQHSAGFNYLLQRLRVQRASLLAHLREGLNLNETQLRYLQAGIYWAGWLESELQSLTVNKQAPRATTPDEDMEFSKVRESLQLVGVE